MTDVLLATCRHLPEGDEDRALADQALARHGLAARWVSWDDPGQDWSAGLTVIRSTWDYTGRRDEFLAWSRTVPRLVNPPAVIAWNSDKTYLRDLAAAGLPVVQTLWAAPGEPVRLPDAGELVIKPSVGAGSRGAGRFAAAQPGAALAHARSLHDAGRTVLVQPYLADVDTAGETALIYFDGAFSHAVRKGPLLTPGVAHAVNGPALFVPELITARQPSASELAVGSAVLAELRRRFGRDLLYARVDLLPGPDGPRLVELELVEPSLFLGQASGAPDRFAAAVAARA